MDFSKSSDEKQVSNLEGPNPQFFSEPALTYILTTYKRVKVLHPWTPWENMNHLYFVMTICIQ